MMEQLDIFGGGKPIHMGPQFDESLPHRTERRDANRARVVSAAFPKTPLPGHEPNARTGMNQVPVSYFGMRYAPEGKLSTNSLIRDSVVFDRVTARKFGRPAEIPIQGVGTWQRGVNRPRVEQLVQSPDLGRDPRFQGHSEETPVAVTHSNIHERSYIPADEPLLINGNHRIAAAATRNEMFQPVRVVDMRRESEIHAEASDREWRRGPHQLHPSTDRAARNEQLKGVAANTFGVRTGPKKAK